MENADERISPKSPIVCLLCLLKSVLWWNIAHGDNFCVSSVDQEEHPHAVRQRRRRRPRRSASQGGLTLWPLTWCEGAFVTAGTCLTLRREGGRCCHDGLKRGSNMFRLLCHHRPLVVRRSDTTRILNFSFVGLQRCQKKKKTFSLSFGLRGSII